MKIKKSVTRSYLGSYLVLIFSCVLSAMMAISISNTVLITIFSLDAVVLVMLIISNVFLYKNKTLHPYFATFSVLAITVITIFGFILQIIKGTQVNNYGQSSIYGWIIFPLGLLIMIFADYFIIKYSFKQVKENQYEKRYRRHILKVKDDKVIKTAHERIVDVSTSKESKELMDL